MTRFDYFNREKIAAIKALRAVFPVMIEGQVRSELGLADAKFAVENWDKWISFVKKNNRIPVSGYYYSHLLT